ncbi:CamS family sex pheromone protein [Facklamia miroungae]|uniref:Protein involved in sex pheromone biosynthesis n=1 Tax=Facklamia miroungae TaxID=120956 RepID=A0A1G7TGF4_9LACT|nr:CamS family sex pheromone protein [Facklamia miroungae]NKZ29842.1 CamS family sex pheromone protein [Facklamia miroungae]SDG34426.1 Protein involved in sex pheromone biosynthesis [Facklamia miroungae]
MQNKHKFIMLLSCLSLLSGCLNNLEVKKEEANNDPEKVIAKSTSNQLTNENYRAVITDGKYQLGPSASSDYTLSSTGNAFAFEDGLLRISREVFPTDQYFLKEGQLIDGETLTSWVGREGEDNPEGLNPAIPLDKGNSSTETTVANQETTLEDQTSSVEEATVTSITDDGQEVMVDAEGNVIDENAGRPDQVVTQVQSTPIYLSQILEKDIMVETDSGYKLAGIVLGLSMNSRYEYTDPEGVVYEEEISMGEMRERGRAYANIIVGRLRATEELRSIPILVGIYRQASSDEIVGGTFVLDGISREGNAVSDWKELNEYRVALPMTDISTEAEKYAYFNNFSKGILNFFPNLNGISGQVLYANDQLMTLDIEIMTQFYQITEITALSQHVLDTAQRTLPENIAIEIKIVSNADTEAFIGRAAGETEYQSHVFRQ